MAASFGLALATLGVLVALAARTVRPLAPRAAAWLVPVLAFQTFSMAQWQNWTWGWQLAIYLNVLAAAVAAAALAQRRAGWDTLGWLVVAAAVAVCSFASGLALLPIIPVALLARGGRRAPGPALAAAAAGAALLAAYLVDFHPVGNPPPHVWPSDAPLEFASYVEAYLGAGFGAHDLGRATAWGAAGLVALMVATAALWTRVERRVLVPWLALAAYAVATGAVTAVGRLGVSGDTALLSRYVTISALFWSSLAPLVGLALALPAATPWGGRLRRAGIAVTIAALLVAAVDYTATWRIGDGLSRERADAQRGGLACLPQMETAPDDCLRSLCWDPKVLRFFGAPLKAAHLGPFRPRS
jgi:hypothetical protein